MVRYNTQNEAAIRAASTDYISKKFPSISAAARAYKVERSTLSRRLRGQGSRQLAAQNNQHLHPIEEAALVRYIESMQGMFLRVTLAMIFALAVTVGRLSKSPTNRWLEGFYRRHPQIQTGRGRVLPAGRLQSLDSQIVNHLFNYLEDAIREGQVQEQDIWNMDETGFQMGQSDGGRVIFSRYTGAPLVNKSNSTQWASIVECVNAAGEAGDPFVINVGKVIHDTWLPSDKDLAYGMSQWKFAYSPKGWIDDELAVQWLKQSFIPRACRGQNVILILDNHGSHCTPEFITACIDHSITLIWIPPHSSHILQPLDCGPFSPLKRYYSSAVNRYTPLGTAKIQRRTFCQLYLEARTQAFTKTNVLAGWRRTGLWPVDRQRILNDRVVREGDRVSPDLAPRPRRGIVWSSPLRPLPATPKLQRKMQIKPIKLPGLNITKVVKQIVSRSTPRTARAARNVGRHALAADATVRTLEAQLRAIRQEEQAEAAATRLTKLKVPAGRRVVTVQDVISARSLGQGDRAPSVDPEDEEEQHQDTSI